MSNSLTEFETYKEIGLYEQRQLQHTNPSCFNGVVRVKKYRITVEEIEEHIDVIKSRLLDLWEACDNMHHVGPLKAEARKYGLSLSHLDLSKKRKPPKHE